MNRSVVSDGVPHILTLRRSIHRRKWLASLRALDIFTETINHSCDRQQSNAHRFRRHRLASNLVAVVGGAIILQTQT